MQFASPIGFLKTLLWVLVGWFIVRTVARLFKFPAQSPRNEQTREQSRTKGEVRIEKIKRPSSVSGSTEGEYVDFEEVKENTSTS